MVSEPGDEETQLLRSAATAPELWRELLLYDLTGSSTDVRPAERCLLRLHPAGEPGALVTALLLLSARRWRRCTARLLEALLATDVLTGGDRDELAELCLYGDAAWFALPAETFDGPVITLRDDRSGVVDMQQDCPPAPGEQSWESRPDVTVARPLQPPLRRWAAADRLRRDAHELSSVRERIGQLPPRHAAAAMAGVLDALDSLPQTKVDVIVAEALVWPDARVRSLAAVRPGEMACASGTTPPDGGQRDDRELLTLF